MEILRPSINYEKSARAEDSAPSISYDDVRIPHGLDGVLPPSGSRLQYPSSVTRSHTAAGARYAAGLATRRVCPSRGYATSMSCNTLAESPTYAIVSGRNGVRTELLFRALPPLVGVDGGVGARQSERLPAAASCKVSRSASTCVGCQSDERALSTGTGECAANS